MKAGELRQRFQFAFRQAAKDGIGNEQDTWIEQFEVWGKRTVLRGGENVMAARLEGTAPAVITIRSSIQARQITTDWRCTDFRTREVYNIRQVTLSEKRDYIDLLVEKGVAI